MNVTLQEKANMFMDNIDQFTTNHVIPEWFAPFLDSVKTFVNDVASTFTLLENRYDILEGSLAVQTKITDALVIDRDLVQKTLYEVENALEDQLQYSRGNCLLIHGVDEEIGREDTDETVLKLCGKIDVSISRIEIGRSHRLGRKVNGRKRPIIVKFLSYRQKKMLYDVKKRFKGQQIMITESLTKKRYALLQQCFDEFGKDNVWTLDGRIYCVVENNKYCITTDEDLAKII
jgi:hypothetical protein